ncbi:MAG TPA: hypothetical protein VKU35_03350 [Candidatus Limnocylindria bacterium]|nr:hypothetical protein [Candidatus Limnocylindria bacterium]
MSSTDLPQLATVQDAVVTSVEWLVEPCWTGDRLMARFEGGKVALSDPLGAPTPNAELATQLVRAIDAEQAVIDGIWTSMPFIGEPHDDDRQTFVAWDLVELDGQLLHDLPLLERRRLLGSVLAVRGNVRISPAVRPPIDGSLAGWQAIGCTHIIAKHVNSRYRPGETSSQWLKIGLVRKTQPSLIDLLLGHRQPKIPHISD